MGFRVLLLEGRDRIGGRIHSQRAINNGMNCMLEFGSDITTGTAGNLLHLICKQNNIQTKNQSETCPLYSFRGYIQPSVEKDIETHFQELTSNIDEYRNNNLSDSIFPMSSTLDENKTDVSLQNAYNALKASKLNLPDSNELDQIFRNVFLSALSWHEACLEYGLGTDLENVSLRYWDQDDAYEIIGNNWFPVGGFSKILDSLTNQLHNVKDDHGNQQYQLYFNKVVNSVSYFKDQNVKVNCNDGSEFVADAVLLTVPLGVLKKR